MIESAPSNASATATQSALPVSPQDWTLDLYVSCLRQLHSRCIPTSADMSAPDHSELMHHYTTTLYCLGVRESILPLWRNYIPKQAVRHSFLMHGLLAFAALHLAYVEPDRSPKYLQVCDKHQAVALEEFRTILSSPFESDLADALFALSGILPISSMARSCTRSETATLDMDTVSELFMLTRGVKHVIQLSREHIKDSPLEAMLESRSCPVDAAVHLPTTISAAFKVIRNMLTTFSMDEESLYVTLNGANVPASRRNRIFAERPPRSGCIARLSSKLLTSCLGTIVNRRSPS